MDVYLMTFTKRSNSTKQPDMTGRTPFTCKLKAPCSIMQPVLQFNFTEAWKATLYYLNYAYLPDFGRYYFITNWTYNGALAECSLKVDTLASFKTAILASSQYVLRAYSDYDGYIKDTKYPVKASAPSIQVGLYTNNPLQPPISGGVRLNGCFVVGIISDEPSVTGCVSYYAMSDTELAEFMAGLFTLSTQWGGGGQDLADGLKKAITDPMQYVISCTWMPYTVTDFLNQNLVTRVAQVNVGYDTVTVSTYAYQFIGTINISFTNLIDITMPHHPMDASRGNYMNYEPFTRYYLSFYPFCNLLELDGTRFNGHCYLVYTVDLRTGKAVLNICSDYSGSSAADWLPSVTVRSIEAQVGVPIPLASIRTELPSTMTEYTQNLVAAGINSEFGGFKQVAEKTKNTLSNRIMGGIAKLFGSEELQDMVNEVEATTNTWSTSDLTDIASSAMAMKSTAESVGSQGTMSLFNRMPLAMWAECYTPASYDLLRHGRPLCAVRTLNTLSGFVMCDHPAVSVPNAYVVETDEINTFLTTGCFIE